MNLKRLELRWRALWIRMLVRVMRRPSRPPPAWESAPHRVLFLRHDRAGDMILSTGILRAIAEAHPMLTIDVLASPANASILDGSPDIGDVIVFDKHNLGCYLPTALRMRRGRYDAVIDCMVTAPSVTTLLLILASGARYRIGIAGRGNDSAFNVTPPPELRADAHMIDHLAALTAAFGIPKVGTHWQPVIRLSDAERTKAEGIWAGDGASCGPRVLINVSAGTSERTWSEANYAAIMRHLLHRDPSARLLVIGAPRESGRVARIAQAGGGEAATTPSIRDAIALVASADLVYTPDTSIAHAASAFARPSVGMYVAGQATRWGLYGTLSRTIEHSTRDLATLPVARMIEAVDAVWSDAGIGDRSSTVSPPPTLPFRTSPSRR